MKSFNLGDLHIPVSIIQGGIGVITNFSDMIRTSTEEGMDVFFAGSGEVYDQNL